jgi:hypothetical protein
MIRLLEMKWCDRLKALKTGLKKLFGGLHGDLISSIVYTVHKRITKIMNTVHINK